MFDKNDSENEANNSDKVIINLERGPVRKPFAVPKKTKSTSPQKKAHNSILERSLFEPYSKAENFINHLYSKCRLEQEKSGIFDAARFDHWSFKQQSALESSKFQASYLPDEKLTDELQKKQDLFETYIKIPYEKKPHTKVKRPKSTTSPRKTNNGHALGVECHKILFELKKHPKSKACFRCKKLYCECPGNLQDEFLHEIIEKKKQKDKLYAKIKKELQELSRQDRPNPRVSEPPKSFFLSECRIDSYEDRKDKKLPTISNSRLNTRYNSPESHKKNNSISEKSTLNSSFTISPANFSIRQNKTGSPIPRMRNETWLSNFS